MDTRVTIAQPYPVLWSHPTREEDNDILQWIRDNVVDKHEVIILGSSAKKIIVGSDKVETASFKTADCLFLFESARDALLFKLTWGGR